MKPLYLIEMVGVDRSPLGNDQDQMKSFYCLICVMLLCTLCMESRVLDPSRSALL
jgi:hypothetical protein